MNQLLRNKLVRKLLTNRVIGDKKVQVDTLKDWVASDEAGDVNDIVDEFVKGSEVPLVRYGGGGRDNIHLSEAYGAVEYLYLNDGIDLRVKTMYEVQYNAVLDEYE